MDVDGYMDKHTHRPNYCNPLAHVPNFNQFCLLPFYIDTHTMVLLKANLTLQPVDEHVQHIDLDDAHR